MWQRLCHLLAAIVAWRFFKPAVFVVCLFPAVELSYGLYQLLWGGNVEALGVDPKATLLHRNRQRRRLTILLTTLAVTPVRRIFKVNKIQCAPPDAGRLVVRLRPAAPDDLSRLRSALLLASTCDFDAIWQDILKRRFIFVGQLAFAILLLLAITSTTGWMRRLRKNWTRLHRLVYVAAIAGIVHFIWIQKSDLSEPLKWAAALAVLLGIRVFWAIGSDASAA